MNEERGMSVENGGGKGKTTQESEREY